MRCARDEVSESPRFLGTFLGSFVHFIHLFTLFASFHPSFVQSFISSFISSLLHFIHLFIQKLYPIPSLFLSFHPSFPSYPFSLPFRSSICCPECHPIFISFLSLIHLLSKVSSMFYLFLAFHPSKYLFSLVALIHLHFLPGVVIFKLSSHPFPAPDFVSLLAKTSALMRVVASLNWCGDLSRCCCCCCCCNPKNFLPLELKVGAFFLGGGALKLPHRFSSFLGVWSLLFSLW